MECLIVLVLSLVVAGGSRRGDKRIGRSVIQATTNNRQPHQARLIILFGASGICKFAVQGSSRSPLMKKGSMSLYSRTFTVLPLGAFPCAIARNACSDCATIARARSFLWIE
jgi:hypothetical protein